MRARARAAPPWALAADILFDCVKLTDAPKRLDGNWRAILSQVIEAAAHMGPAAGERDRPTSPRSTTQALVGGIAVDLENASEGLQVSGRMFAAAAGRVKVGGYGWITAALRAVITSQCPKLSSAGSPSPRVE